MKAVAYQKAGPITSPEALVDIEIDTPVAKDMIYLFVFKLYQ